tara:strand:- start:243 stop:569 length:327 start_codon:yes stop_codon:yes gene_type:complete
MTTRTGIIYCIKSQALLKAYTGSTTKKYASERISQHRYDYKHRATRFNSSSFEVVCDPQAKIEVLERFEYTDIKQLRSREGEIMRALMADEDFGFQIVNKRLPKLICV